MRLDKFLSENMGITRSEAKKIIRKQEVTINNIVAKDSAYKVANTDIVYYNDSEIVRIDQGLYFMLHKPEDFICSNTEENYPSIYQLFDYPVANKLHTVGRLDVDTTGLLLLTDDGAWSHRITSPKYECAKTYFTTLADPIQDDYADKLQQGILLHNEKKLTKPAKLEIINQFQVNLTISEGRYHQVKRMFAALGNKVVALHRVQIGAVILDSELEPGEFRALTQQEIDSFN